MTYKKVKWGILFIPTLTIGIWEYVRHAFLLPYITMETGNWLSPLIVMIVTLASLLKLFSVMERLQEELNRERAEKAILMERERIARELHDGIAQSLFLLSVKIHQLEQEQQWRNSDRFQALKETIRRVHDDVRQAISNLKSPPSSHSLPWKQSMEECIHDFEKETGIPVTHHWDIQESSLSPKEKVELSACLRESLMNIRKHANAHQVEVQLTTKKSGWLFFVEDDGQGFTEDPQNLPSRYGVRMMRERAKEMGWSFDISRRNNRTRIEIRKGRSL